MGQQGIEAGHPRGQHQVFRDFFNQILIAKCDFHFPRTELEFLGELHKLGDPQQLAVKIIFARERTHPAIRAHTRQRGYQQHFCQAGGIIEQVAADNADAFAVDLKAPCKRIHDGAFLIGSHSFQCRDDFVLPLLHIFGDTLQGEEDIFVVIIVTADAECQCIVDSQEICVPFGRYRMICIQKSILHQ